MRTVSIFSVVFFLSLGCYGQGSQIRTSNAVRSVTGIVHNDTSDTLAYHSTSMDHGIMADEPTPIILPGGNGFWIAESNGVATGTEGRVAYEIKGTGKTANFHFNNPYVGSNSYDVSVPKPYKGTKGGGGGDNSRVTFRVRK